MKKAFTLIELLIVTVVIAILSSIVFRVTSSAGASEARQKTINRMQRLENCLSGYFAAYGSYPPVAVHGSRNPFYELNDKGNQKLNESPNMSELNWKSVKKACQAQPVMAKCPDDGDNDADGGVGGGSKAKLLSDAVQQLMSQVPEFNEKHHDCAATKGFDAGNAARWLSDEGSQGFQFGLMSFLLPRVVVMMTGPKRVYNEGKIWTDNNTLPCRFSTGVPYESWGDLRDIALGKQGDATEKVQLELIPSQAVCRRWIANLEKSCSLWNIPSTPFGVDLWEEDESGAKVPLYDPRAPEAIAEDLLFSGNQAEDGQSNPALPNKVTVKDGYGEEFYYYSPPPFQSYRLWSGGANKKTFPPWVTDDQIQTDSQLQRHASKIHEWIADDIVHMSN